MNSDYSISQEDSILSDGVTNFRIYSDTKCDRASRLWNPNMDLLLNIPIDGPVTVTRLIVDDAEESGLVFTEQLPFKPTAAAWHPSGRALAVGDSDGNIFGLNADVGEERRIMEIQKLTGTSIASMQWGTYCSRP